MGWQSRTIDRFRPVFVSHDPRLKIAETTHRKLLGNRDGAMEAFSTIMDGNYHPPCRKSFQSPNLTSRTSTATNPRTNFWISIDLDIQTYKLSVTHDPKSYSTTFSFQFSLFRSLGKAQARLHVLSQKQFEGIPFCREGVDWPDVLPILRRIIR